MRTIRRLTPALPLVALVALTPLAPAAGATDPSVAGQLAYVTASGELDLVTIDVFGTTSDQTKLGPVTIVTAPKTVKASAVVASNDGKYLGWSEAVYKPNKRYGPLETSAVLVVHDLTTGDNVTLRSEDYPIGFAGDTLIVSGAHAEQLVTTPTPHLVRIPDGGAYPVATYADGIVDVTSGVGGRNDTIETDRVRLTTLSGHHTLVHTYKVGRDYRSAAANIDAVSPDGHKLLIELGNHQDFAGLGPSSNFDAFRLDKPGFPRQQIGHYGTNHADWRLQNMTFAGPNDTPWVSLHSGFTKVAGKYVVRGVVATVASGKWHLAASHAIAVAGNAAGFVVVQPGAWRPVKNSPAGEYDPTPTAGAMLYGASGGTRVMSSVQGSELLWIP